jgi:hypothetical protein
MTSCKGLDDLLAAGAQPRRLRGPEADAFFSQISARLFAPAPPPVPGHPPNKPTEPHERPPFPIDVFPEPLAAFARAVAAAMGCPIDFPGVSLLVVSGAAIGAARSLQVKGGWFEKPGMYAAIISPPGTTKTPVLKAVMAPVYEEQARLYREHREAVRRFIEAKEAQKQAKKGAEEGESSETPVEPPPLRHLFAGDTTVEALARILSECPKGLLVCRDELTALMNSMNQYKAHGSDREFFLSAWSGETVKVDRKGDQGKPIFIHHPFLSVLGCITPDRLTKLQAEDGAEDGFRDRFLYSFPAEGKVSGWLEAEITEEDVAPWKQVLGKLQNLEPVRPEGASERPRFLTFDHEGREAFKVWFDGLTDQMNDEDFPRDLIGPFSKMKAYCARFALVLHLLRVGCGEAGGEQDEGQVDAEDVSRAARLCDYFMAHFRLAFGRMKQTAEDRKVGRFMEWMRRKKLTTCTARDICRYEVCGIKTTPEAVRLLHEAVHRDLGELRTGNANGSRSKDSVTFVVKSGD